MILLQVKGGHNCFQSNVYFIYSRASVASEKKLISLFSNIWYIIWVLWLPWLQVGASRGRHNCILRKSKSFSFFRGTSKWKQLIQNRLASSSRQRSSVDFFIIITYIFLFSFVFFFAVCWIFFWWGRGKDAWKVFEETQKQKEWMEFERPNWSWGYFCIFKSRIEGFGIGLHYLWALLNIFRKIPTPPPGAYGHGI